jgi:hemolysin III
MLGGIWLVAVAGIVLRLSWMHAPRALYTAMYVGMGWFIVVEAGTVVRVLSGLALSLVVAGGVVYTIGAIVYAAKRPNPYPRVFGFHEIWHLFVLAGSALHFAAIFVLR